MVRADSPPQLATAVHVQESSGSVKVTGGVRGSVRVMLDQGPSASAITSRPCSSTVPIVEHLTNLDRLPAADALFTAVPPAVVGMGTFPVRAFAVVP